MKGQSCSRVLENYSNADTKHDHDLYPKKSAKPEPKSIVEILRECRNLERGRIIHACAIESGEVLKVYVANTLVNMYARCGSMVDARDVFDKMARHSVVSWTALITGYAKNGEEDIALHLFGHMSCVPDAHCYLVALKACTKLAATAEMEKDFDGKMGCLQKGLVMHSLAKQAGCDSDIYVADALIDMYAKCGVVESGRAVFDSLLYRNVACWTTMIWGYVDNGQANFALALYACMQPQGCTPDARTFVAVLKACAHVSEEEEGKNVDGRYVKVLCLAKGMAIHAEIAKFGHESDIYVANSLVVMYAKCGSMVHARAVYDKILHHDRVSCTTLMMGYADNGDGELALQLYSSISDPDSVTFIAALKACASLAVQKNSKDVVKVEKGYCLCKGKTIYSEAIKRGFASHISLANTLVDMYSKCGSMADARSVFDKMPCRTAVSWTVLIMGYAENGESNIALQLFSCMLAEGIVPTAQIFVAVLMACANLSVNGDLVQKGMAIHSQARENGDEYNSFVASALIDLYAKCGKMSSARAVFDKMSHRTVASWSSLIWGYTETGEAEEVLRLYTQMQGEGVAPDGRIFVAALKACGSTVALETGKKIHEEICLRGFQTDAVIANCLIDFYGKCASMSDAQHVFDSTPIKDHLHWSTLIAGYTRQGDTQQVFALFEIMRKEHLQIDGITLLSVLTACSHAGFVEKGKEYFQLMITKFGISPSIEHYDCMIDMLGRTNQLDEAVEMIKNMPLVPNSATWTTILGACRKWNNMEVGKLAFESLMKLNADKASPYLLMANIYGM